MNIRTRRLKRDHEKLLAEIGSSEFVGINVVSGDPPSHYQISFKLDGLKWDDASGTAQPVSEHMVDINLPIGYPKIAPRCTMRTPIWHPNIGDYVCIGDFWSAGVTLADIVVHIADMIQYKSYNLGSPVSKPAAEWARRNTKMFPVGDRTIRTAESDVPVTVSVPATKASTASSAEPVVEITISAPSNGLDDISIGPLRERYG